MLKQIIYRLLRHRHPWRDIDFNELSEIYTTMMLRSFALSMTGIFVPVYLYSLNYSVTTILSVFAAYFTTRVFVDIAAAHTTAKIGPKHTLVYGQLLQILSSAIFLTISFTHIPALIAGAVWGAAASYFFIPFHIDFSKIKHKAHGGKEIGFEQAMEKIGSVLGPLAAGVVASLFGAKYIFLVSILLLLGGLWPLFRTREPTRLNQKLKYNDFPVSSILTYLPSYIGLNIENTLCLMLWPLFLAAIVLPGDSVFLKIGLISSLSVVTAVVSARVIGRKVDQHKGRKMLRISAVVNALVHLFRPFVSAYPLAFAVNLANEGVTSGYRLPYTKGMYDTADDFPGFRIVFISTMESLGCIAKATMWWILVLISLLTTSRLLYIVGFYIAAAASLLITTEKFKSLDVK